MTKRRRWDKELTTSGTVAVLAAKLANFVEATDSVALNTLHIRHLMRRGYCCDRIASLAADPRVQIAFPGWVASADGYADYSGGDGVAPMQLDGNVT